MTSTPKASPEQVRAVRRYGGLVKNRPADDPDIAAVQAEIQRLEDDGTIDQILAASPRLTDDQLARLATIFQGAR
jgi:hypothetical protein